MQTLLALLASTCGLPIPWLFKPGQEPLNAAEHIIRAVEGLGAWAHN